MREKLQLELAGSYWQVLTTRFSGYIKLAYCSSAKGLQ